jgi:hypothetical protein
MLLCKYFVFIHFPKAGGSFIRETLARHIPQDWNVTVIPGHGTVQDIPEEYSSVPRFGFIRNPWDWYVSLYSWWHAVSENDPKAFEGHILQHVAQESSDMDFKTIIRNLLTNAVLEQYGIGPMSWVYMKMFGHTPETIDQDPAGVKIKKFEEIRENILNILESVNAPVSDDLRQAILRYPPINSYKRSAYRDYYDDELRALVAMKDQAIIKRYGYTYK